MIVPFPILPPMAYRVIVNGLTIECEAPEEVIRLAQAARQAAAPKDRALADLSIGPPPERRRPGRPPKNGRPMREQKEAAAIQATIAFLELLQRAGSVGADSHGIVRTLSLSDGRGIGGALLKVRRIIIEHGFLSTQVFRMKGLRHDRRWKRGPDLVKALEKLANGKQENE